MARDAKKRAVKVQKRFIFGLLLVTFVCIMFRDSKLESRATTSTARQRPTRRRLDCIKDMVNTGSPVHGFVKKEGPLDIRSWHSNFTEWRETTFWNWMKQTTIHPYSAEKIAISKDEDHAILPKNPPLFPYCRVFVNHRYKFIYLRAPKTGSTSLIKVLGNCDNPDNGAEKPTCLSPLQVENEEQYKIIWSDYLVFGFARNPWQRSVSSYRMMVRNMKNVSACAQAARWDGFCEDPLSMGRIFAQYPECVARAAEGAPFAYHHVIEQTPCLLAPGGGWAADFIGRVESFDEDIAELMAELEVRRERFVPDAPMIQVPEKAPNANGKGCVEVPGEGMLVAKEQYCNAEDYFDSGRFPRCFDQLAHYYQKDVQALGLSTCL